MTILLFALVVCILLVLLIERSGIDGGTARILSLIVICVTLVWLFFRYAGAA